MNRQSTLHKEEIIIKEFQRLLRSGKDYSACSMYEDAGKKCIPVIVSGTVGNIIRNHYRNLIQGNKEMYNFVKENPDLSFKCLMEQFSLKFKVQKRESRFMIRYIRYMKEPKKQITDIIKEVWGEDLLQGKSESANGREVDMKQALIEMNELRLKDPDYKFNILT